MLDPRPVKSLLLAAVVENATDQAFKAIHEAEWQWRIAQAPSWDEDSDNSGLPPSDHLSDVGSEAQARRLKYLDGVLKKLDGIDTLRLSPVNQVNFAVYRPQIEHMAAEIRFRDFEMPFNADSSFWSDLGFMARSPLRDAAAYRAYAARLRDVPRYFDQQITNMRAGLARGFSVPRAVLDGREVSIAGVANLKDPETSSFFDPYRKMPPSIPVAEQAALRAEGRAAITDALVPAFAKLLTFFRGEYVPHARQTLAAEAMPEGEAWYREQIRKYTTLDLTPDEIHAIGLTEVASIRAEMDAIIKQVGFNGSFAEFLTFLRTDPQFYAKTPQDLLDRAAWISRSAAGYRAVLDRWPRWRRYLLAQHLRSALATAVQPARADPARVLTRPFAAGLAGARTGGGAGFPQGLHQRLWRRLGPVFGMAGQGNGNL